MDPSGGNFVHTFSLGSNAEDFRSRDVVGAGLPTECLYYGTKINYVLKILLMHLDCYTFMFLKENLQQILYGNQSASRKESGKLLQLKMIKDLIAIFPFSSVNKGV